MDRDPDSPSLVGNRPSNSLANPPSRIGRELEASVRVKLLDCPEQPCIALLNQVKKVQTSPRITLGNRDHQAHVSLCHLILRSFQPLNLKAQAGRFFLQAGSLRRVRLALSLRLDFLKSLLCLGQRLSVLNDIIGNLRFFFRRQ